MYSESDLDAAVTAGVLTPRAAGDFREFVAGSRSAPAVDEEYFRLVTGFNDIFVTIAAVLLLVAVASLTGPIAGFAVAAVAWALAEYFTRQRRMALPSIALLLAFVGGIAIGSMMLLEPTHVEERAAGLIAAAIAAITAGAAYAHWQRFHVPITIAAGTSACVGVVISVVLTAIPGAKDALLGLLLAAGLVVFAFAMWWDMSDRERLTRRSDVAFWLHLLAAPMIAHPLFWLMGVMDNPSPAAAGVVILLYAAFAFIALAVDRRALLVSSLAYVLYALSVIIRSVGSDGLGFPLTALVIGSALLSLSAFWHPMRRRVVVLLPDAVRDRLPALDRPASLTPRPAA